VDVKHNHEGRVCDPHCPAWQKDNYHQERGRQAAAREAPLRELLSEARIRLDQYVGMCACPGEVCVSACRECNATQDLTNRIRALLQGRT
jgi:hypothetical protein